MILSFTAEAERSLERIGDYIAADNPERAISFLHELQDKARQLAELPNGFPLVPRYADQGIRRRSYRGYGILYSVETDRIIIHRFIGPGQDHDRLLGMRDET